MIKQKENNIYIFENYIGDIGVKYLGLALSKLIKLKLLVLHLWKYFYNFNLIKDIGVKYIGLGLS